MSVEFVSLTVIEILRLTAVNIYPNGKKARDIERILISYLKQNNSLLIIYKVTYDLRMFKKIVLKHIFKIIFSNYLIMRQELRAEEIVRNVAQS